MAPMAVVAALLLLCYFNFVSSECPRLCECKWKSGKESVLCLSANLSTIPQHLEAGTQVIDLTSNDITTVPHDAFSNAGLLNLQKIYLAKCRLKTLDRYAFRKLINLVELDLSYNILATVPSHVFDSISELRELKLSGNPIQRIVNDAFIRVPELVRLELSDCKIGTIEPKGFSGLESSLEWLKIDGNRLIDVRSSTLTSLQSLHGLELAGNPWNCTCGLRPLREWMLTQNIPFGIPPVCSYPTRLARKPWDRLELDEFACVPEILASVSKAHGVEGRNVTMSCRIGGVPEPNVRWMLRNRVIANLSGIPTNHGKKLYVVHLHNNASNLTILTADVQDAGVYVCAAENKAGKVEASVTLAVSRKPPEGPLTGKVLVASIIVAALFVIASCLLAVCVCTLKKRRRNRWNNQTGANIRRREDSYEKIEMNHKVLNHNDGSSNGLPGPPGAANDIAVVNLVKRRGDYLHVPTHDTGTEDEDAGYDEEMETPTPTAPSVTRETKLWKAQAAVRSPTDSSNWTSEAGSEIRSSARSEDADLHIPRLSEFRTDSTPESGPSSTSGQFNMFSNLNNNPSNINTSNSAAVSQYKAAVSAMPSGVCPTLQPHVLRKQILSNNGSLYTTDQPPPDNHRTVSDGSDSEKNYPDLLDINSFNTPSVSFQNGNVSTKENVFCTLPRGKRGMRTSGSARYYRGSDSQSPLLPDSRYGSSGGEGSITSHCSNRRLSVESYNNYPLSNFNRVGQRSSSFLNLASPAGSGRRNPSLPGSPVRELPQPTTPSATPLLNISNLNSRADYSLAGKGASSAANTYDYHAAQLERFLEEYRTLQEQLCKMKETCDNIRQGDNVPIRTVAGGGARFADPLLYNQAVTPSSSEDGNPKSILKNKTSSGLSPLGIGEGTSPITPGEPPPYWLPRNTLLKRFSGGDFFQS